MVLAADRKTRSRIPMSISVGVEAGEVIFAGALVARDADGHLVPAAASTTIHVLGCALDNCDNTDGADGDIACRVEVGCYQWNNSAAADEITIEHIGLVCYAVDDETVALTDGTGTRSIAGRIFDVDADGVWVDHDWAEQVAVLSAGQVDSAQIAAGAVDPVHLASGVRTVANDGTPVIGATDRVIEIQKTANTTTAITMTATHAGHMVWIKMLVGDVDSVYTAAVVGGTVTFNAAEEAALLYYDGTEWRHLDLQGATFA